ncbi:MAG TPA: tripartite tricarboxylate transporter substrate-binding protein, partial [Burkholderiales bacterium]|nr:tripartite tricarboxylate transporter substrate-binding protein [Burkholderiales bacterium]
APALSDLIAGQVQLMFPTAASVIPHVAAGRLRALAVTSPEPSPLFPGLTTVSSSGLPGYESESMFGVMGPARMPRALVERLSREIARVLTAPDIRERLLKSGVEAVAGSPEQFGATMKAEMARLGKVIRDAGIRSE